MGFLTSILTNQANNVSRERQGNADRASRVGLGLGALGQGQQRIDQNQQGLDEEQRRYQEGAQMRALQQERLGLELEGIKDIRFAIKQMDETNQPTPQQKAKVSNPFSASEIAQMESLVAGVSDPILRRQYAAKMNESILNRANSYYEAEFHRLGRIGVQNEYVNEDFLKDMQQRVADNELSPFELVQMLRQQREQFVTDEGMEQYSAEVLRPELMQMFEWPVNQRPASVDENEWKYRLQWLSIQLKDWETNPADPRFDDIEEFDALRKKMTASNYWATQRPDPFIGRAGQEVPQFVEDIVREGGEESYMHGKPRPDERQGWDVLPEGHEGPKSGPDPKGEINLDRRSSEVSQNGNVQLGKSDWAVDEDFLMSVKNAGSRKAAEKLMKDAGITTDRDRGRLFEAIGRLEQVQARGSE